MSFIVPLVFLGCGELKVLFGDAIACKSCSSIVRTHPSSPPFLSLTIIPNIMLLVVQHTLCMYHVFPWGAWGGREGLWWRAPKPFLHTPSPTVTVQLRTAENTVVTETFSKYAWQTIDIILPKQTYRLKFNL